MLLKGRRILIVEDNVGNKAIAQMLLERAGARTDTERWGTTVVDALKQQAPFDIILLDLMLPYQVSGFDVFQQIRQIEVGRTIPIVAVSAADASTAIPRAQTLGFSGYISKPLDFQLFPQQIYRIICGESLWYSSERL
jgi:CheY-like chemotaxis protein